MKKIIVLGLLFIVSSISILAEDAIITKDREQIICIVEEVGLDDIKYRKIDNLNGPIYIISKSDITSIRYQNGNVDTFNIPKSTVKEKTSTTNNFIPLTWNSAVYKGYYKMDKDEVYLLYNQVCPEAFLYYNKGRKNTGWGIALVCIGGVNTVFGAVSCAYISSLLGGLDIALGLGLVAGGIPLICVGKNKQKHSVYMYNQCAEKQTDITYNITAGQNGVGFAINF